MKLIYKCPACIFSIQSEGKGVYILQVVPIYSHHDVDINPIIFTECKQVSVKNLHLGIDTEVLNLCFASASNHVRILTFLSKRVQKRYNLANQSLNVWVRSEDVSLARLGVP